MEFSSEIKKIQEKIKFLDNLFNCNNLQINFDSLNSSNLVENEILYFKSDNLKEFEGLFIFGFNLFLKDLKEQEFKEILGLNSLNLKIHRAYRFLIKKQKEVNVSDIINLVQNKEKDSLDVNEVIGRILSLAYYLNWDLEKNKKDIEGDFKIKMPNIYSAKLKNRFNFNLTYSVYENDDLFIFLNAKSKLYCVFKELDKFSKKDIQKFIEPILIEIFKIKNVEFG